MSWVWRWLLLVAALAATTGLPVPDEIIDTSTKLLGSSVVTSVSVVMGHEDGSSENGSEKSDTRKVADDLPPSTVDMLKPDGFQFYTVDEKGQLITRQMTDAEIQSIIAAGGGPFPAETQDPEKTGDNTSGETKVADVVQNVQNVLKGELSKPAMAIGTVPTIPGHANEEWSSILPSILGGDTESAPVTLPEAGESKPAKETAERNVSSDGMPAAVGTSPEKLPAPETAIKPEETETPEAEKPEPTEIGGGIDETVKIDQVEKPDEKKEPERTEETASKEPERPMIQVPVITADSDQSTTKDPSLFEERPVYQILNTISADEMKDKETKPADTEPGKTGAIPVTENETPDSSPGIISATEKTENEVKEPEVAGKLPAVTTESIETTVEMEITSSFVPSVQETADKIEAPSGSKGTEEAKPTVDAQKLEKPSIDLEAPLTDERPSINLEAPLPEEKPSINLEAPLVEEKPADPLIKTEEKEAQDNPEVGPITAEKDTEDKNPSLDETPATAAVQTETTTSADTVGEEVSEIVNHIPESISSIVDELISEGSVDAAEQVTKDKVESDDPVTSAGDNDQKEQGTTVRDSVDKTDDGTPLVSTEPDSSDVEVALPVVTTSQIPATEAEPVFEMLPEITPNSSVTKTAAEAPAMSENVGNKPEAIEAVSEATKISVEEKVPGDKIDQQANGEAAQSSIPVTDEKEDSDSPTTQKTSEKKPETLLTELADSVSSMISQVSELMPSMVPIPQKPETKEPPLKRVEDATKSEEASTVRSEDLPATVTVASVETAEPSMLDVESSTKEETTKPEKSDPEMVMVEVKNPELTTLASVIDESGTTKASEPLSESGSDAKKTESPTSGGEEKISESGSDKEPQKLGEPEKIKDAVKDETKPETDSDAEAPIVRIDITEAKPTVSDVKNGDSTESSVVRIQLTNTVSTINQMIDSAPETVPPVSVQEISFPEKNVLESSSAANIGSSLIAGAQPSNLTGNKSPQDLPEVELAAVSGETANMDSDVKTTLKTDGETSSKDKPQPEIEGAKIPAAEATQVTTEAEPEANDEGNKKSPKPETELTETDETAPENLVETQNSKDSTAPVDEDALVEKIPVKPVVKIDPPVSTGEKIESTTKIEAEEEPELTPEKIVEPATTVVTEDKIVQTDAPKPVKEPAVIPAVKDTPTAVPAEVVVSTTVDVQPTKEAAETVKDDAVEPSKTEEQAGNTSTKIAPDSLQNISEKPEVNNTATEMKNNPNQSAQDLVPVELATPASTQPDLQLSDQVAEVSTPTAASGDEGTDKTEAQEKIEAPATAQTDSKVPDSESADIKTQTPDVKTELSAVMESGDASEAVKESVESVAKPEMVKTEDPKSPPSEDEPEKKTPGVTEPEQAGVEDPAVPEKDKTSVPLVRIDVTPEKNQTTTKIEETPESMTADEKSEKPASEIDASQADESSKKDDKPKDDSAVESPGMKPVEPETTIGSSESSSKAPAKDIEETKAQLPATNEDPEVIVKTTEESVKETVKPVESKLPEATVSAGTSSSTSPNAEKIENEVTAKPVVRIETNSHNDPENTPVKTQEIRIQVNDTAVLVTKQKIPQNMENDEKKVQPSETTGSEIDKGEVSSQPPEKIEVSSQQPEVVEISLQPPKIPSVQKPVPVRNSQESNKTTSKQDADKVKPESTSQQKKPIPDPYAKLGEKKPEQKPAVPNPPKVDIPANKRPANTGSNKTGEDKWTLIPQSEPYPAIKPQPKPSSDEPSLSNKNERPSVPLEAHHSAVSLAESTRDQEADIGNFADLCNELAFSFWIAANKGLSTARSLALSPFGMTSMLAMVFLGARGPTSGQMNDILKLDDVVTFNPHLVFQNVSDSVNLARGQGIANAAFVRELFADRLKAGRLLPFYKERAQQFYDGHVEEVNFATISDLVRRRTNLLVRRQTGGRIRDFVKGNVMPLRSPLAALSANVFQTDCTGASSEGRDGEMYFAVLPAVRQRKLVPVPATVWRSGVLAGYEPGLDATVVSLGGVGNLVSTIFVLPGQQGLAAPGDSLDHLERRLLEGAFENGVWNRLIRVLIPRMGLEVQVPKFSHRSVVNATAALKRMGLDELFSKHADLKGINGVGNDLHLADMLQINLFSTCGDEVITGGRHHVEIYPASPLRAARVDRRPADIQTDPGIFEEEGRVDRIKKSLEVGEYVQRSHDLDKRSGPLPAEKQLIPDDKEEEDERSERSSINSKDLSQLSKGKQNERPLLKLDRPFLYFVRHNPTGMILHMGRFNPRLMP